MNRSRSRTVTEEARPTNRIPSYEDQIRDYRYGQRIRHRVTSSLRQQGRRTLESRLNPEEQLRISQRRRASLVPAEVLYDSSWSNPNHRVYQHYSERRVLVTEEGQQEDLRWIVPESYNTLRREQFEHIHLGLMMVRIHALHRRDAGTQVLIVFRDTRWSDDRQVLGTLEVDMTTGTQLIYFAPNMMLSIGDFYNHIQLSVQTRGYEGWQGESNLLITTAMIGRLTNTGYASFRYNVRDVVDYLATNGIQAIAGEARTTEELRGHRWILQPSKVTTNL